MLTVKGEEVSSEDGQSYRHLLITGVGRGGTTALAALAAAFGLVAERPTAYWESPHLRRMALAGNSAEVIRAILRWRDGDSRMFWKDPKLSSAPFAEILSGLPSEVGIAVVLRDPLATAIRRSSEGGSSVSAALLDTMGRIDRLLRAMNKIEDRAIIWISYEKLLTETSGTVRRFASYLGIEDENLIRSAEEVISPSPDGYVSKLKS